MPDSDTGLAEDLCAKWMPKAKTRCARKPGHSGVCMSVANMDSRREYRRLHPHRQTPEAKKKTARKSRIAAYGLTQQDFAMLLREQGNACAMCFEPFQDGQPIHVDHDHGCCKTKNRSCGRCVRGLLCHACNVALGHIERRYALAREYLDSPPSRVLWSA